MQKKIAHCTEDREQTILEHLQGTAKLAEHFSADFNIENAKRYAYVAGLAHDIGKYSELFQKKIRWNPELQVDHSTAGAIEMRNNRMSVASFCVAGHHGGLPNGKDTTESCLIKRIASDRNIPDYSEYKKELFLDQVKDPVLSGFSYAFYTRMLYSSLVDADFLDTEAFMSDGNIARGDYESITELHKKLADYIVPWLEGKDGKKEINKIRTDILKQCIEKGKGEKGVYSLTVPTGGGKTVSSMAFALEQAVKHNMARIIYVIPYTSIIEQNAALFRKILGDKNVVEHHANIMFGENEEEHDFLEIHKLSTENWDAPVIVTTNVQFFESLFSNRASKCRKLHNIANSVIIFDEAQMIPLSYIKPCVRAIEELVLHYKTTAVLCTATQPALDRWFEKCPILEISENFQQNFIKLKRAEIRTWGKITQEELVQQTVDYKQILVIVNKKKVAQEIYKRLPEKGAYHLSTYMIPVHRKKTIQRIRQELEAENMVRVVSTSLIEAGVDIDFPIVWREKAGIDSIVQAAGRCNREGKRRIEDSQVFVFELPEVNRHLIEKNIAMTRETIDKYGVYDSLEAIQYYFSSLQNLDEEALDVYKILQAFDTGLEGIKWPFKKVNEVFHLIDSDTKMVIVPIEEAGELTQELERCIEMGYNYRLLLRKLGKYSVNVFDTDYQKLIKDGHVYEVAEGIGILQNLTMYDEMMGLCIEDVALIM